MARQRALKSQSKALAKMQSAHKKREKITAKKIAQLRKKEARQATRQNLHGGTGTRTQKTSGAL